MINQPHKKIVIAGCGGSGKTTLGFRLKEKLNLPLYHLDQYYWKPYWQRVDLEVFSDAHDMLCAQDEWIIEGSYIKFLFRRCINADIIIFLDIPRHVCLWNVIKRSACNWGKVIPGNPEGCKQRLFSFKFLAFLKWIWDFKSRNDTMIADVLEFFKDKKQIYIVKSFKEFDALYDKLCN